MLQKPRTFNLKPTTVDALMRVASEVAVEEGAATDGDGGGGYVEVREDGYAGEVDVSAFLPAASLLGNGEVFTT